MDTHIDACFKRKQESILYPRADFLLLFLVIKKAESCYLRPYKKALSRFGDLSWYQGSVPPYLHNVYWHTQETVVQYYFST